MTKMITRFAPSPTGNLHIGSVRTALINFICKSKNKDSKLYLRIEDTDNERSKEEFKDNILSGLKWLGIDWDNEPQIQSQNIYRHLEIANKLLDNNLSETPSLEKTKQIGPGWLGLNSPFSVIKGVNGWGQQAFWCLNLIRMGENLDPDLDLGVFKAFLQYQKNEKNTAKSYKEYWESS